MDKEDLSAKKITEIINGLNITKKKKSKKRIQEILKKIEKDEKNNQLFKIKKDPDHKGRGRKIILYNENYLQRVIEYYHKDFYFTDDKKAINLASRYLITPKNIEDIIPPNIKRRFRDSPQEKENFKRNIYKYQLKLGDILKNKFNQYELNIQELKQQLYIHEYRNDALKLLLSIKNLEAEEKLNIITSLETKNDLPELSLILKKIKYLKLKEDNK